MQMRVLGIVPEQTKDDRHDKVNSGQTVELLDFESDTIHLLVVRFDKTTDSTFFLTKPEYRLVEVNPADVSKSLAADKPLQIRMRKFGTTQPVRSETP
jgi:hypothetical protein